MNDNAIIPVPKIPVSVRPATLDDFAFIDALQTKHSKQLGYMPRAQMESKIKAGHVMVACSEPRASARGSGAAGDSPEPEPEPVAHAPGSELGFIIGTDRYF